MPSVDEVLDLLGAPIPRRPTEPTKTSLQVRYGLTLIAGQSASGKTGLLLDLASETAFQAQEDFDFVGDLGEISARKSATHPQLVSLIVNQQDRRIIDNLADNAPVEGLILIDDIDRIPMDPQDGTLIDWARRLDLAAKKGKVYVVASLALRRGTQWVRRLGDADTKFPVFRLQEGLR